MTCRRSQEIDLLGFLEAPRRPEFDAFREHYPRCADCAGEVRAWTELQLGLRAQGAGHPAPELLLVWADAPDGLAAPERNALAAHLEGCPTCRDELRSLGAWSPAAAPSPAAWRGWWAALRRVTWHPAFAYALVGLLLFPVLYRALDRDPEGVLREAPTASPVRERAARPPAAAPEAAKAEGARPPALRAAEASRDASRPSGASAPAERAAPPAPTPGTGRIAAAQRAAPEPAAAGEAGGPTAVRDLEESTAFADEAAGAVRTAERAERAAPGEARLVVRAVGEREGPVDERADASPRAPEPGLPVVRLEPSPEPVRVEPRRAAAGLALRLPLPAIGAGGAELVVELAEASGPRALRERLRVEPGVAAVELEVPSLWLVPGHYRASVRDGRGRFSADFRLEVASR